MWGSRNALETDDWLPISYVFRVRLATLGTQYTPDPEMSMSAQLYASYEAMIRLELELTHAP